MFSPEQKIQHLKSLGFDGDLSQIYNLYCGKPFNVNDPNYQKLVNLSYQLCDEYTRLLASTLNPDSSIVQHAETRRNEIIDILFPGHGSIYGFGQWSKLVIGLVDVDGFNLINVRCQFSPTSLVHLNEYVFVAPNVVFGDIDIASKNGMITPSKIVIKDNTWICSCVNVGENVIVGNQSVVALGAQIANNSTFDISKLIVGSPAIEKKTITADYSTKKSSKILRSDDQMRKLIQNVRDLGFAGDLEQYVKMLNCENHNCLEPVMNELYNLTHKLCAEFNDPNTSLIRKDTIAHILFPLQGTDLRLGKDLYVDILGATQLGNNVTIGDRVNFAGNVYVGNNVNISDDAVLQTIGHEVYYKGRQLQFHPDGYPIETNTTSYIIVGDNVNIAKGSKIAPSVTLARDTTENELIIK